VVAFLWRTGRYAQVGLLCALINNLVVIAMDRLGYRYVLSVTLASLTTVTIAYLLHTHYTFRVQATVNGWLRFAAGNVSGFLISMTLMFICCDLIGLSASIAMPITTALLFLWNYLVAHLTIAEPFRERA
jgi:putative flippase GtrA